MIRLLVFNLCSRCTTLLIFFVFITGSGLTYAAEPLNPVIIKTSSQFLEISDKGSGIIYQIRGSINLDGNTVVIPKDCTLQFKRGKIKNGRIILYNTSLVGKVNFQCDIEGTVSNSKIQMDWFVKGVSKLKKLKNTSEKIQAVFNLGARKVVFGKGYYQFNNIKIGKNVEIVGNGTIVRPAVLDQKEYNFNFLKNVFYSTDADTVIVKCMTFEGEKTGTILPDFKSTSFFGEPIIWVDRAMRVIVDGCVFKNIENCTYCNKAYHYYGKKQGSCVCLWDVTDASFINCEQVGNRHDEQVWIIAVNKPIMETKVTYSGNYVHDMNPGPNSSAFTCVAGTCTLENIKVERYSYPGSMFNVFAKRAIIKNNEIKDSYCSSVFDVCEYSYFHNDEVLVEDNHVDAVNSVLVLGQSAKTTIRKNVFRGLGLYYSANSRRPASSTSDYHYWYSDAEGVLPVDEETVIDGNHCDFTAYDGNRSIAGTTADYGTGEIIEASKYSNVGVNYGCGILIHPHEAKAGLICITNNIFTSIQSLEGLEDKNNLAGIYPYTIRLINTENAIICGNTFNGGYTIYNNPEEVTCIGVYNYPDEMEMLDKPSSISLKPSEYGKYVIENNVFNVGADKTFYPVFINPRVNAKRQTELVISELVVRYNKLEGVSTKEIRSNGLLEHSIYKQSGPVKVLKEIVK